MTDHDWDYLKIQKLSNPPKLVRVCKICKLEDYFTLDGSGKWDSEKEQVMEENDPTKWKPKLELPEKGWECPRCGSVNAPKIEKCKCNKTESASISTMQLLLE